MIIVFSYGVFLAFTRYSGFRKQFTTVFVVLQPKLQLTFTFLVATNFFREFFSSRDFGKSYAQYSYGTVLSVSESHPGPLAEPERLYSVGGKTT